MIRTSVLTYGALQMQTTYLLTYLHCQYWFTLLITFYINFELCKSMFGNCDVCIFAFLMTCAYVVHFWLIFAEFLQARASIAIAHISYGNSVLMSVTTRYQSERRWDRNFWFLPCDSLVSSILRQNFMPLGEGGPHERGRERGASPP